MNHLSIQEIKSKILSVVQKYELELVVVFGSAARGTTNILSDLDFAVRGLKLFSYYKQAEIALEISEALKFEQVEVVDIREIKSSILLKHIARDGIVLYSASPHLFAEFQIYAYQIYFESKPLIELDQKRLAKHMEEYAR